MPDADELWIPLVDEPIGSIVQQIVEENPDIAALVESPHRILAFRTFAYIRCGVLLGQLLFLSSLQTQDTLLSLGLFRANGFQRTNDSARREREHNDSGRPESHLVPLNRFLELVKTTWRASEDWL